MKRIVWLSLLSCLLFSTFSFAAEGSFDGGSFFKPIQVAPKESPKPAPKVTPKTNVAIPAKPAVNNTAKSQTELEASVLGANAIVSNNCSLWWQFALGYAIFSIFFAYAIRRWRGFFKKWNKLIFYYILLISGLAVWAVHYYLHFYVYKYDLAFLCYNYWMVIGFEVIYFWMIYSLLFGFRNGNPIEKKLAHK